jgi:hypothetical protein
LATLTTAVAAVPARTARYFLATQERTHEENQERGCGVQRGPRQSCPTPTKRCAPIAPSRARKRSPRPKLSLFTRPSRSPTMTTRAPEAKPVEKISIANPVFIASLPDSSRPEPGGLAGCRLSWDW